MLKGEGLSDDRLKPTCPQEGFSVEVLTLGFCSLGSWPVTSDTPVKLPQAKGELIGRILEYLMQSKVGCVAKPWEGTDTARPPGKQVPRS